MASLAQLNAIRHDLDGNGAQDSVTPSQWTNYTGAFPNRDTNAATRMGCPGGVCVGYELTVNIDLDTDGDGSPDSGDAYWDSGAGWQSIGPADSAGNRYAGNFKSNRFTISNLFINRNTANYQGLFGAASSRIESVGITNANVTGGQHVGILVGASRG